METSFKNPSGFNIKLLIKKWNFEPKGLSLNPLGKGVYRGGGKGGQCPLPRPVKGGGVALARGFQL